MALKVCALLLPRTTTDQVAVEIVSTLRATLTQKEIELSKAQEHILALGHILLKNKQTIEKLKKNKSKDDLLKDFEPADNILVACSGGADSLALAWTSQVVTKRIGLNLIAVIIDHQLIKESSQVAQDAKKKQDELDVLKKNAGLTNQGMATV